MAGLSPSGIILWVSYRSRLDVQLYPWPSDLAPGREHCHVIFTLAAGDTVDCILPCQGSLEGTGVNVHHLCQKRHLQPRAVVLQQPPPGMLLCHSQSPELHPVNPPHKQGAQLHLGRGYIAECGKLSKGNSWKIRCGMFRKLPIIAFLHSAAEKPWITKLPFARIVQQMCNWCIAVSGIPGSFPSVFFVVRLPKNRVVVLQFWLLQSLFRIPSVMSFR